MTVLLLLACAGPDDGHPTSGELLQGGVVTCDAPEERETLGPMREGSLGSDWDSHLPLGWEGDYDWGEALAVADLTGDGHLDVFVADRTAPVFYASDGDTWHEESASRLPDLADDEGRWGLGTVTAVDIEGDGDLDLFLGRTPYSNVLLLNDGTGVFTDVTASSGLATDALLRVRVATFGDLDGDEDLDLFVGNDQQGQVPPKPGDPNLLYRNDAGVFVDVTDTLSDLAITSYTRGAGWYDVDGDDDQDLYIVNHMPVYQPPMLMINDGSGQLTDDPSRGADVFTSGMGLGVADLNADHRPDFLVAGWAQYDLLESQDDGTYANTAVAKGLVPDEATARVVSWGTDFADMDNDGRLDVGSVFGQADEGDSTTGEANPPDQPDGLWLQDADGHFTQVADEWGVGDTGQGRALALVDLDEDGWLDWLAQGKHEAPVLWTARCGEEAWLKVRLSQEGPNPSGIGAMVRVEAGEVYQTRWISAMGSSLQVSLPPEVHVGLGDAETADITVRWPDGGVSRWSAVATRQVVTVVR